MLVFFFIIIPKINAGRFKMPLGIGFLCFLASQVILVLTPNINTSFLTVILMLVVAIILEACALSLINPLMESLQVLLVDVNERARIISIIFVAVLAFTSPFGYIAGLLSSMDRRLPFTLNIILIIIAIILVILSRHQKAKKLKNIIPE
jgi:MFS family permease